MVVCFPIFFEVMLDVRKFCQMGERKLTCKMLSLSIVFSAGYYTFSLVLVCLTI